VQAVLEDVVVLVVDNDCWWWACFRGRGLFVYTALLARLLCCSLKHIIFEGLGRLLFGGFLAILQFLFLEGFVLTLHMLKRLSLLFADHMASYSVKTGLI
jgi:hypothetical protein